MTQRLSPDDWVVAGFRALSEQGPKALKAEVLARRLKTTKGSFYWHFADVAAFHGAMLQHWRDKAVDAVIDALATIPDPPERLRALARAAGHAAPDRYGGAVVEPAMRAWALDNPAVAASVAAVDRARIAYVGDLLDLCGCPRSLACVFYGAYVGLDDLGSRGLADAEQALLDLVETLLQGTGGTR